MWIDEKPRKSRIYPLDPKRLFYSFIFLVGEIEALHAEYVDKLEELYKEYNQQYGDTNIKLQIIWLSHLIIKATL